MSVTVSPHTHYIKLQHVAGLIFIHRSDVRAVALDMLKLVNEDPAPIIRGNGAYSAIVDDAAGDTGLAR